MKKNRAFLRDLCASVVNNLFRCATDGLHAGDRAGAERVFTEVKGRFHWLNSFDWFNWFQGMTIDLLELMQVMV